MDESWSKHLQQVVRKRRLVVFQFDEKEWDGLREFRRGLSEFTIARSHGAMNKMRTSTACLIFCRDEFDREARFGLVHSRSPISTLESRVRVTRTGNIHPSTKDDLFRLITERPYSGSLRRRLESDESVIVLSPELSAHVVRKLAGIETNQNSMRAVAESITSAQPVRNMASLQQDAVQTALRVFGLSPDQYADQLELLRGEQTALATVNIVEDSVVEHDARHVPGYELVGSDVTGRAVFRRGTEILEVYTANRRPLEKVFGVDLIYLNAIRQNIVMLQYKMLERNKTDNGEDWIYRPDGSLKSEIGRMRKFQRGQRRGPYEYRLNGQVFYLKFVKRDGLSKSSGVTMPIDHFERLRTDPSCQGPKGAFRISFKTLAGRYLRQAAFLDLVRSGYIGAHAETTEHLKSLVTAVVEGDRAVVAAIQSLEADSDSNGDNADSEEA